MRRVFTLCFISSLAALSAATSRVVIGRLGRTKEAIQIYSAPSGKSDVVGRMDKGLPVVVRNGSGGKWLTVVLKSGEISYAPAQSVEVLPFKVTADASTARAHPSTLASRGGLLRRSIYSRNRLAAFAEQFEGTTPYKWGGEQIGKGIDCSAFVRKVFSAIHISLPRTAAEQALVGKQVDNFKSLRPGDRLYFWDKKRGMIGHCGIYVGGGYFTHSSSGRKGIARDAFTERWRRICVVARR